MANQILRYWVGEVEICREMPSPDDLIIAGVRWGDHWALFTPAYWLSQLWMSGLDQHAASYYQAKGSLCDEIAFCMLGGARHCGRVGYISLRKLSQRRIDRAARNLGSSLDGGAATTYSSQR